MIKQEQQTYVVMGMDIAGYSEKEPGDQLLAVQHLDDFLAGAFKSVFPDQDLPAWADAGDGGFCLFNGADVKTLEVCADFYRRLEAHNMMVKENACFHVRTAFHKDLVHPWEGKLGFKYCGIAINQCARLLSAMDKKYQNQVICSEAFHKAVSSYKKPAINLKRLKDGKDKHGNHFKIYNVHRSPGLGIVPEPGDYHKNPAAE